MEKDWTHNDRPDVGNEFLILFNLSTKRPARLWRQNIHQIQTFTQQPPRIGAFDNNILEKKTPSSFLCQ